MRAGRVGVGGAGVVGRPSSAASGLEARYKAIKVLGQGSFGKALLVEEVETKKLFVVKQISLGKLSPREQKETQQEASLLSTLAHPNIVAYIDSYVRPTARGTFLFIVMEYADSGDLHHLITQRQGRKWSEDSVLNLFVQVCLALKHLHDRKIVHRDLKPQNIFVTSHGVLKLGDFGIARVLRGTQQFARTKVGTPLYMAPEVLMDKAYNHKADMWSLGCILYELTALTWAFQAKDMKQLFRRICRAEVQPVPSPYSQNLRQLVSALLSKEPGARPSTNAILKLPFVRERISRFLSECQIQHEFSHTVLHGQHLADQPNVVRQHVPQPAPSPALGGGGGGLLRRSPAAPSPYVPRPRMRPPVPRQSPAPQPKPAPQPQVRRPPERVDVKMAVQQALAKASPGVVKRAPSKAVVGKASPLARPSPRLEVKPSPAPRPRDEVGVVRVYNYNAARLLEAEPVVQPDMGAAARPLLVPPAPPVVVPPPAPPPQYQPRGASPPQPAVQASPAPAPSTPSQDEVRAARVRVMGQDYAKNLEAKMRDLQLRMQALGGGGEAKQREAAQPGGAAEPGEAQPPSQQQKSEEKQPVAPAATPAEQLRREAPALPASPKMVQRKDSSPAPRVKRQTPPQAVGKGGKKGGSPLAEAGKDKPARRRSSQDVLKVEQQGKRTPRKVSAEAPPAPRLGAADDASSAQAGMAASEARKAQRDKQREEMRALMAQHRQAASRLKTQGEAWGEEVPIMVGKLPDAKPLKEPPAFIVMSDEDREATGEEDGEFLDGDNTPAMGRRLSYGEDGDADEEEGLMAGEAEEEEAAMAGQEEEEEEGPTLAWGLNGEAEQAWGLNVEVEQADEAPTEPRTPRFPDIFEEILQFEEFAEAREAVDDDEDEQLNGGGHGEIVLEGGEDAALPGMHPAVGKRTLGATLKDLEDGARHGYALMLEQMYEVLAMGSVQDGGEEGEEGVEGGSQDDELPATQVDGPDAADDAAYAYLAEGEEEEAEEGGQQQPRNEEDDEAAEEETWHQISRELVLATARQADLSTFDEDEEEGGGSQQALQASLGSEIEVLRMELEAALGLDALMQVYQVLRSGPNPPSGQQSPEVLEEKVAKVSAMLGPQLGDRLPEMRRLLELEQECFGR